MNILFFSGHYWYDSAWFRKHQFALRLAKKGHRVFFVENSVSLVRIKKNSRNKYFRTYYEKIDDNFYLIIPSALFPYPKNLNSKKLYNLKLFYDIKRIFKKIGVNDFLLWTNRIDIGSLYKRLSCIKVLDICDDIPYYSKLMGDEKEFKYAKYFFELSLKNANIPIVSALKIKEKYQSMTKKEIIVIPNGHDIEPNSITKLEVNEEVKNIPSPRIGFIGSLFQFIDNNLIEFLIRERPTYNFIFLGGIEKGFPIENIKAYKNVFIFGKKDKKIVPQYIKGFDICINPFKVHEVNNSVNPVKVFEYLALKKPVISTFMYSLMEEPIAKYIEFADSYDNFLQKIDDRVKKDDFDNPVNQGILEYYHWDSLFNLLIKEIYEKYNVVF